MKRALPNDKPLGEPKQKFEDTFSAAPVLLEHFREMLLAGAKQEKEVDWGPPQGKELL
jgi:hypothetical protein